MDVLDCLGTARADAQLLASQCAALGGTVILLSMDAGGGDRDESWVASAVVAVLGELQSLQRTPQRSAVEPVTIVCAGTGGEGAPMSQALFEATRGIAQSVTLESGASQLRCNVLRVERASDERLPVVLRYLSSPDGAFALGSTLDLVGAR